MTCIATFVQSSVSEAMLRQVIQAYINFYYPGVISKPLKRMVDVVR